MADISKFIGGGSREEKKTEKFKKLSKGKSKKEIRELEQKILTPSPIPKYKGKKPRTSDADKRKLLIYFRSLSEFDLFKKHIGVNDYQGANTRDLDMIMAFIECIDNGSIKWNPKTKKLYHYTKKGLRKKIRWTKKKK